MFRVSRVLSANGLVAGTDWFTPQSRDRGRTVHYIGEQVFRAQPVDVAPDWAGYETALRAGIEALGFVPVCIEQRFDDGEVTGRPDAVGWLPAHVGQIPAGPAIVDIKSGDPYASHAIQLALYERLVNRTSLRAQLPSEFRGLPWQRIGLYVRATGTFKLVHYRDQSDRAVCDAVLDLTRWRLSHGLLKPDDVLGYDDDPATPDFMEANDGDDLGVSHVPVAGSHLTLVGGTAHDPDGC